FVRDNAGGFIVTAATYFKAPWATPFPVRDRTMDFAASAGSVKVPSMMTTEQCRHGSFGDLQVLEKEYAGGELAMVILLPASREMTVAQLEESLDAQRLDAWTSQLRKRLVEIELPRFRLGSTFNLALVLNAMGMTSAFDSSLADFSVATD